MLTNTVKVVNEYQNSTEIYGEVVNNEPKTVETTAKVVKSIPKGGYKAWKKGQSGNPNGKPKGALSAKTKAFEELGLSLTTVHAAKFNEVLGEMLESNPEKGMYIYLQVLEYFKPKLNRTTLSGDGSLTMAPVIIDWSGASSQPVVDVPHETPSVQVGIVDKEPNESHMNNDNVIDVEHTEEDTSGNTTHETPTNQ